MDRLWAPWRIKYVSLKKQKGCIFCASLKAKKSRYLVFKTKYSFALLNLYPYNNGHLLICPLRHVNDISELSEAENNDLMKCLVKAKQGLDAVLKPHGYNIGMNLSRAAGAGVTGHLHFHIVPRWKGDVNFMTAVSNTKIISQSLDELHKKLKRCLRTR